MATKYWVGRAASVAQVTKVVYSSIVVGETYSVTINGKTVSYTATTTVLADLIDALVSAWGASAEPEHQEMIAAQMLDPTLSGLSLTGTKAGRPSTVTASATTGTATVTEPTAASGPNFWNLAANWNGAALPSAGDTLYIRDSDVDILYGLTDTNNYAAIYIESSFTATIGLPATNANGYPEYRTRHLTLGTGSAITCEIGYGTGSQPRLINLDFQGSNTTLTVFASSQNTQNGYPVNVIQTGASSTVNVYGGAVYFDASSTATIATLNVIERPGANAKPTVRCSSLVTCTTVYCSGGTTLLEGNATTLTVRDAAQVTVAKASAIPTVKVASNSQLYWNSSAGIGTKLTVEPRGTVDFGQVGTTKTVAACDLHATGTIKDPMGKVTWTAGIVLQSCRIGDVSVDKGVGVTI